MIFQVGITYSYHLIDVQPRGAKCRFSHTIPDSEEVPQDKRQRQHIETNNSYMNKNDSNFNMGAASRLDPQKESIIKEKLAAGPPMQLKVCNI